MVSFKLCGLIICILYGGGGKHSEGTFSDLLESPGLFWINVHRSVKL